MKTAAIIVAAGSGTRMGGPKQFLPLADKSVVEWSLETFLSLPEVEHVALVLSAEHVRQHETRLASARVVVVEGGATRMASLRQGFAAIPEDVEIVAVHDGARPLITASLIRAVLEEAYQSGAAIPAVLVKDTLKKVDNKQMWVSQTPARSMFWNAQTPQCYRREILAEALNRFPEAQEATDESQLVEKSGHKVKIVPSSYQNFKITTPEDLTMAESLMETRHGGRRRTAVGFGFDIHPLAEGRALWLGGIRIDSPKGLLGHSDGDAVLHACGDAVLGAMGAGEIGIMFPPDNLKTLGIPSKDIIAAVMAKLMTANGDLAHLDVTVVAETPKLKPYYEALRRSLAQIFGVGAARINLKAKTHEGLDSVGQGRAISCYAVATLSLPA